ncbi:uncharacterized protein PITG_13358 [Phytophthora infestans T30-4]|uniref:Uncharacterized protein n=1 Tax=Phytophthora infestans (strain T30-4) TaxID=403677 RepID=D0NLS8_PHYIT|nr:uncharacterized protein PITG_13358 [Phytophthora infestans T30-4]EEY60625.1 conserved hypothetical protein [Phytophthora infestans T30-4]|eukprot:XP_002899998.1 conserved hypothetical protein [Phytophthora infestans T30-4]
MNKAGAGNTYSTICAKLCAVRWYHRNNVGYDPGVDASHAILLRGIRRFTSPVTKQYPLSHARDRLLWGGLLLGYFFLLQRSEYLYIGHQHHAYVLKLSDITFHSAEGQHCKPRHAERVRFHEKSGDTSICPVVAARWIRKGARAFGTSPEQPALSTGVGTGISAKELASTIKTAARQCALLNAGADRLAIKVMGSAGLSKLMC